jgi:hypothetical protein
MAELEFDEWMRSYEESRARMEVHAAAVARNIAELEEMLAAAGYRKPPEPAAPPARPARRQRQAVTPASTNWSVMTKDPAVSVDIDGSFVL